MITPCDENDQFIKEFVSDEGFLVSVFIDENGNEYRIYQNNDGEEWIKEN